jgi:hypothetical protein
LTLAPAFSPGSFVSRTEPTSILVIRLQELLVLVVVMVMMVANGRCHLVH